MQRLSASSRILLKSGRRDLSGTQPKKTSILRSSYSMSGSFTILHTLSPNVHGNKESKSSHTGKLLRKNDLNSEYFFQPHRHAGHSKWSNIKHIKGAKDAKMHMVTGQILKKIKTAIKGN